jgi:hypothetical protein
MNSFVNIIVFKRTRLTDMFINHRLFKTTMLNEENLKLTEAKIFYTPEGYKCFTENTI